MSSFKIKNLSRISTCFIHRIRDMDAFFFRELEVNLTELWSLVSDTRTICIGDEVSMVYLMIFVTVFLIIILRKWWKLEPPFQ